MEAEDETTEVDERTDHGSELDKDQSLMKELRERRLIICLAMLSL